MKVVRMNTRNQQTAIIREIKSLKPSNSIFISEEELKNMEVSFMIA